MAEESKWMEQDSREFIALGEYFTPEREVLAEVVTSVINPPKQAAQGLDLCCGQGWLSAAVLKAFPQLTVVGMDISEVMLKQARQELAAYGDRFSTEKFDLSDSEWRKRDQAPYAVVSSLAIHHLDAEGKRRLFQGIYRMLEPEGHFVIIDLIAPKSKRGVELARRMWDEAVREQSLAKGSLEPYQVFHQLEWNSYQYPDPLDKPSSITEQLDWLREAGFEEVDVYWMKAGHAIFGGSKAS